MTQPRPEKGIVLPGFYPPGNGGTTGNFTPLEKKKKTLLMEEAEKMKRKSERKPGKTRALSPQEWCQNVFPC